MDTTEKTEHNRLTLNLYELFLIYTSYVGLASISLLALKTFKPTWALLLGIPFTLLTLWLFKPRIEIKDKRFTWILLLLLLGALVFRVPPYLYLMGGQDQGTYVNISKQYETQGTLYYMDYFRDSLTGPQKKIYDKLWENLMPSFEKWNRPGSEYTMKFYPMHPAFMAIFGNVFGSDNRVYSLTFFSLISLVNIYLIVTALSKSRTAGYISVALLGLNPLHVFFSKMPVGEVTGLAFVSAGFYFLIRFLDEFKPVEAAGRWFQKIYEFVIRKPALLYLSSLMFFAFMFVRMTFFTYIILFFILSLGILLFSCSKQVKVYFISYTAFLALMLSVSYVYYSMFLRPLFEMIFEDTVVEGVQKLIFFANVSAPRAVIILVSICAIIFLLTLLVKEVAQKKFPKLPNLILALAVLGIIGMLVYAVDISVGRYVSLAVRGITSYHRWNLSGQGLNTLKNLTMFSIGNHVSWIGILLYISYFIYFLFSLTKKQVNLKNFGAFFVFSFFFVLYAANYSYMRYDYYNSRYFLSEAIPAFIVFASLFIHELLKNKSLVLKSIGVSSIVLICTYYLVFSVLQFKGPELPDTRFYKGIVSEVSDKNSILVFVSPTLNPKTSSNFNGYIFGSFKYYYNLDTIAVESTQYFTNQDLIDLLRQYDNKYILSTEPLDFNGTALKAESSRLKQLNYYHYNNGPGCGFHNYEFLDVSKIEEINLFADVIRCNALPNAYFSRVRNYHLYKVNLD